MKLLSIGLNGTTENIREKLERDCKTLTQEGFRVDIEELDKGGYKFLGLTISDGELSFRNYERIKNVLKHSVAQILADWIITNEEHKIINKLVTNNYFYFNHAERAIVEANTLKMLSKSPAVRYKLVLSRILEYLENHHVLVLEGFLNFRLKDYRLHLSEVIDNVVDDFMMELEYREFIRVLRYFVDVQEPRVDEVHLIINDASAFQIYDAHGKTIKNQCVENSLLPHCDAESYDNLNYEDLVVSALITIAPRNIMVHISNPLCDKEVLETIKSVFEGRVVVCEGCELCMPSGQSTHTEL